jgi:anti-anti-sigma factor
MEISEYEELGVTVYSLDGRVDTEGVAVLKESMETAMTQGKYKLILDMAKLEYINSAGLRVLSEALTTAQDHGGDLVLVGMNDRVFRVFQIVGFTKFFPVKDNVVAAMDHFS